MYEAPIGEEYCTTQIDVQNCFPQYHGDSFLTTCKVCVLLNVSWVKVILVAHELTHSVTNTHTHTHKVSVSVSRHCVQLLGLMCCAFIV